MKTIREILIILAVLLFVGFLFYWSGKRPDEIVKVERQTDTVFIRDTLFQPIPIPSATATGRTEILSVRMPREMLFVTLPGDTVEIPVYIPIERKEYTTPDYHAVVEGWKPELVELTLFPQTKIITNTEVRTVTKRHRWGIGLQVGYGFNGQHLKPYIGIGVQYNFILW